MNKDNIYEYLDSKNIKYEVIKHDVASSMDDIYEYNLPHKEANAKNIFMRDKKKKNYYLVLIKGSKRLDMKEFREKVGSTPLSLGSEEDLNKYLHVEGGNVTPLALLNDKEHIVKFYLDKDFFLNEGLVAMHPFINDHSLYMKTADLVRLLKENNIVVYEESF